MTIFAKTSETWNYWHLRLEDPDKFIQSTLRTLDSGREKHSMQIRGVHKDSKRWATQAWRISKDDVKVVREDNHKTLSANNIHTQRVLQSIRSNYGKIVVVIE